MKKNYFKRNFLKYLLVLIALMLPRMLAAQTTETFETATTGQATFTNGTKTFNLASSYISFTVVNFPNLGYNSSNRFIQVLDAANGDSMGQTGTISDATGSFKINSLFIYVTGNAAQNPGVTVNGAAGSITFKGKLGGVTQFTVVKNTAGTNLGLSLPNNGFIPINFATEGGTNNTGVVIDQLEIQLSNNYDYFAIDNFIFQDGAVAPTVTTTTATNTGAVKATMGGNVTADGGDSNIERGIVWATTTNPTTSNNKFQIGTGTGTFSGTVSSFPTSTLIHYRAYAKNGAGTSYGADLTFTTGAALGTAATGHSNVSCNGGSNGTATVITTGGKVPYSYSWSPSGGTGATAVSLAANTYTVTITDNEGTQITRSFNITQPTAISASITAQTNNTAFGGTSGSATITASGGIFPYSYSWSPSGGNGATATGLAAGTYTVTITDDNTCQTTVNVMITQPTLVLSPLSQTNIGCRGASTGSATVAVTSGTGPYSYSWSPSGGTAATASGLAAGTYTVTVTGTSGTATQSFTVTEPATALSAATGGSKTDVSCSGGTNGTATVSAIGGTPGYTYSWSPAGGTAATASGLAAGTYTVTVTDANGCTAQRIFVVNQPSALSGSITAQTNNSVFGGTSGSATATASGGTPGYTYSWSPSGGTAATATGLSAGTYTVTITDANSCTTTTSVTITQPSALVLAAGTVNNISCFGGSNGTATVNITTGTGPYTYSWSPTGGTGATASGLSVGTYTVTVNGAGGSSATQSFTLSQPPVLVASASAQTNISCFGGTNGSATVNATGGTGSYTYSWSPSGGTAATASGLAAGTYTVTVTDANSCTATQSFTITQPPVLTATAGTTTNVSCNGGSNGSAKVDVTGGTAGYTYSWSPTGGTGATASGLSAGTYTVTVTDANSCTTTQSFTITEPPVLVAGQGTVTNISCNGGTNGTATVAPTGGTGPYTYSWSPTGGTGATASGLAAGTYTVTVTDANGCTTTQSFTLTQPAALVASASAQTNISCFGGTNGSATVSVTGGTGAYTYSWSPSGGTAATASGLSAGTYVVTVTDANSCTSTQSFTITQPSALVATAGATTNISCNGGTNGSATVSVTGGTGAYTYSWSPSGGTAATASGLSAGTYVVTITDANSCTTTQSFTITQPAVLVASAGTINNVSCNGGTNGSATVVASGGTPGYTYSWSPSGGTNATASGLAAGTYVVTVTDANSCTTTQSFTITEPPVLVATAGTTTNVSCNGGTNGSAKVDVTGGTGAYTYVWSPSGGTGATASGLSAGTYTVTVTDANSCTTTQSFTLTQPAVLVASASAQTNISCNGGTNGSATVSVTGGTGAYTYSWSPSGGTAATASGLSAGTYVVTVTDANSCTSTQSFTITQPSALVATAGATTNISCNGGTNGSATVSVTGGTGAYTYSWSPSGGTAATASGLAAGTYTVTVTDANSCTTTQGFTITQPAVLVASQGTTTNVSCNGGSNGSAKVDVTGGTGGYSYVWSPTGGTGATAIGLSAGTYVVTVTDANSCTTTQGFTITEPAVLVATAGTTTNVSCNGGSNGSAKVDVTGGTGGYSYVWSPTGGTGATASGLSAGTYTVTVTDANSCTTTQSFTITQPPVLVATAGAQTNISCNGGTNGSATVSVTGGTGAYTYSWSPSGGTAATASGLSAGTYTVTVTDANGCTSTQSFTITQPSALVATAGATTNISCNGGTNGSATVSVTGGTGAYTYSWSPSGGTAATASGLSAGTYVVTIRDANLCSTTQGFTITQPSALVATAGTTTNVSCFGGTNGSATVNVTGGTAGYTYSWSPTGGTGATATGLSAGTYVVTVTDANGCSTTQAFTITSPSAVSLAGAALGGGKVGVAYSQTVAGTGASGSYTYTSGPLPPGLTLAANGTLSGTPSTAGSFNISITATDNTCSGVSATAGFGINIAKGDQAITFAALVGRTYGDAPFGLTATGGASGSPVAYTSSNPLVATVAGGMVAITGMGTTTITASQAGNANYDAATPVPRTLTVVPLLVKVVAEAKAKTYGDADPVLTYTFSPALVAGDSFGGSLTRAAGEDVGSYAVTQGTLALSSNYELSISESKLAILPRAVTITADAKAKTYGEVDPVLTYTVGGGPGAGTVSGTPSRAIGEDVGSYAVTRGSLSVGSNYTVSFVGSSLEIGRRALEVRADNKSRAAGTANPVLTASYSGFRAGEDSGVLTVQPTVTTTATTGSPAGSYDITVSGAVARNYAISYQKGTLTVLVPEVNDAPTLDAVSGRSVCTTTAEQTIALSGITAGREASQTVALTVSSSNPALFGSLTVAKGTGTSGTLAYRPVAGAVGTATITVTVRDNGGTANGGTDTFTRTFTITINALPVVAISANKPTTVAKGEQVVLTASGGTSYVWADAAGIVSGQNTAVLTVRPTQNTTYTVTATNAGGCSDTRSITISVTDQVVQVKATNIMSPNGDGVNDRWVVENLELYPNNSVTVFDRAGRVIFQKKGYDNSWDATLRGLPLSEGTYYYVIDYNGDGKTVKKGFITILNKN